MSGPLATKKCILIIDDDKIIRQLLSMLLEFEGYTVKEAVDGEDARQKLDQTGQSPDLIVLDMMMPQLDGIGFLNWLRKESGLKVPVLAVTGMNKTGSKEQILAAGADKVLFKPLAADLIVEQIHRFIDRAQSSTAC